MSPRRLLLCGSALVVLALAACGGGASSSSTSTSGLSAAALLGEQVFRDTSLSASGRQACISCHDPSVGHAAPNALAAQLGGPLGDQQGGRSAPSIRYLERSTGFQLASDGSPSGGFFWDGRADSLKAQAAGPFLNPVEMANESVEALVTRLAATSYASGFQALYGADIFQRPADALQALTLALQAYQSEDADFHPYDSKYDAFLRGQATLSDAEARGLALFNSPSKGNCNACHPSAKASDGQHPLFTDFSYDALGVPRNTALNANADVGHYDLGLCAREALAARTDLCGAFKVPSLRNVALRQSFFHNGRFGTLKEALTFYVQRDTSPEKWYPLKADGSVDKFNDLPQSLRVNVNTSEAPYNRQRGGTPALSDTEIDDVIAFLKTLNDGYQP